PTAPSIGELPTSEGNRPGWTRWAIPLTLAAIVAAAAVYEWLRPGLDPRQTAPQETAVAPAGAAAPTVPAMSRNADTPLPNPMAAGTAPAPAAASSTVAEPASRPATAPAAAATPSVAVPPSAKPQAAIATPGKSAASVVSPAAPPATDATLALTFRDYSWVEVKDRNGQTLLSRMNAGGTSESISGAPPFEVVIGNASDVRVTFRGKVVDLAPHTRQNIARLTLP
ncbi:MAG: DUF4115 domain-containing protein, partial [Betaproteobacteria bacterium]